MQNELIDFLIQLHRCDNQSAVWEHLTQTSLDLGFNISIFAKLSQVKNTPPTWMHNYENDWKVYYAEKNYHKYDAFYHHTFKSSLPTTLDCDKKQSHLVWEKSGINLLNEVPEAGLKRALFLPMLNDRGTVSGSITLGTELMSSKDFENTICDDFALLQGVSSSAYNKLNSFDNALPKEQHLKLTPRQNCVLRELAKGRTNKQIAYELNITVVTVSHHLKELQKALNIEVNRQILPKAYALGLFNIANIQ